MIKMTVSQPADWTMFGVCTFSGHIFSLLMCITYIPIHEFLTSYTLNVEVLTSSKSFSNFKFKASLFFQYLVKKLHVLALSCIEIAISYDIHCIYTYFLYHGVTTNQKSVKFSHLVEGQNLLSIHSSVAPN